MKYPTLSLDILRLKGGCKTLGKDERTHRAFLISPLSDNKYTGAGRDCDENVQNNAR